MGVKKYHLTTNVLEEARKRMAWVFDEFKHVYVSFSGGKDSTVVLNLALDEAARRGRLPQPVLFIDQEAEWQSVIDYIRTVMYDPRVKPYWLQVPIRMTNNTSTENEWLYVWDPKAADKWIHPKDPISIKRNVYGVDRFKALFSAVINYHHYAEPACSVGGVRCEESPGRTLALTVAETAKGVTWGAGSDNPRHFVFYPIYDWTYRDVWKAIHEHNWPYCSLYDKFYQYGVHVRNMRVSNVHHETAMTSLMHLQEIEPATWERLTARLPGINSCGQLAGSFWVNGEKVPWMFASWVEYRDYLLEHLITNAESQKYFRHLFERMEPHFEGEILEKLHYAEVCALVINDLSGVTIGNFMSVWGTHDVLKQKKRAQKALEAALDAAATSGCDADCPL